MKIKVSIFLLIVSTFFGCSDKIGFLSKDRNLQNALVYTKKGQIYNSLEIKATIVATYLNPLQKRFDDKRYRYFLIDLYIDNDSFDKNQQGLYNPNYSLTLNGLKPDYIKFLDYHDDLVKVTPIKNEWSNYYLVRFKRDVDMDNLKLKFKSSDYGEVVLNFSKVL